MAFISKDEDQMRTLLRLVDRAHIRYKREESEFGGWAFRGQFSYAALYRWLLTVGLMPRKSLVLGGIDVPDEHLMTLARGLLDGDGSVYTLIHRPTLKTYRNYKYERLWTRAARLDLELGVLWTADKEATAPSKSRRWNEPTAPVGHENEEVVAA